jgi:hypothetical protein
MRIGCADYRGFNKIPDGLVIFSAYNFRIGSLPGIFDIGNDIVERCFVNDGINKVAGSFTSPM